MEKLGREADHISDKETPSKSNTAKSRKIHIHSVLKLINSSIFFILFPFPLLASDEPFTGASNTGGTGLMEIPTARVIKENSYRFGVSQVYPYRRYYVNISPFKGTEIYGGVTEILDLKMRSPGWSGYGNYKDKVINFKVQILPEGKYIPALAIGIMDPHGTRLYPSQYVVASKQIWPFDFTVGFGNGRFGKRPLPPQGEGVKIEMLQETKQWLKDSQFFWGVEFAPSEKFSLMFEYSPIKYHKQTNDPAQAKHFRDPVPSPYNFGLRLKPYKWLELDVSYQRGKQIGLNLSMNFNIGRPLIPIYDPPYVESQEAKNLPTYERLALALYNLGFININIDIKENQLWIEAENTKYYYNTKAIDVILRNIVPILDEKIHTINITLTERGIPLFRFTTTREDAIDFLREKLTVKEFLYLSTITTDVTQTLDTPKSYVKAFRYGIKPSLQTFLNDPSGFFKYRFGVSAWLSYNLWDGTSLVTAVETYPINNISSVNKPLSIPVRSDIADYKNKKVSLSKLMLEQIYKMPKEIYLRGAVGLLEVQYAGIDVEIAKPLFDGRVLIGLSGSVVKKRDPNDPFEFKSDQIYKTAFVNTRIHFPEQEVAIDLKTGRFLGGDKGVRITVSKFINGVIISAWYSFTNTSVFRDEFNRGYHDKGIAVTIPIRLFRGSDSRTTYSYALSPWTRDVAQDIEHHTNLFDFISRNTKIYLDKDFGKY